MSQKIQVRRGAKSLLPTLDVGELGFTIDTKEFFIGATGGNVELASVLSGGYKFQSGTLTLLANGGGAYTTVNITFPKAFSEAPIAFGQLAQSDQFLGLGILSETTTGLSVAVNNTSPSAVNVTVKWYAIGT